MKLYELTESYRNILEIEEDADAKKALDIIDGAIEEKADSIAKLIRELEVETKAIKSEEDRLSSRRKALENKTKWLKSYLEESMIAIDKKKFKTDLFSFSIQKNRASLKIKDESKVPEEFVIIEKRINKEELTKAVKDGNYLDCAELVQTESLRIRWG